jgi:hypothetical protein
MTTATDHRQAAAARLADLIALLQRDDARQHSALVDECEALARAVAAFHMEGIRFRMFNVDRLVSREPAAVPAETAGLLEEIRTHLEAAGFHTRSHHAPGASSSGQG